MLKIWGEKICVFRIEEIRYIKSDGGMYDEAVVGCFSLIEVLPRYLLEVVE